MAEVRVRYLLGISVWRPAAARHGSRLQLAPVELGALQEGWAVLISWRRVAQRRGAGLRSIQLLGNRIVVLLSRLPR